VLVVVGLMNLGWMGALTLVFLAEKNWRHGVSLTRLVGSALMALGVAVLVSPGILDSLSGGGAGAGEMMSS
jgi:predicted metal-binding membrane protein